MSASLTFCVLMEPLLPTAAHQLVLAFLVHLQESKQLLSFTEVPPEQLKHLEYLYTEASIQNLPRAQGYSLHVETVSAMPHCYGRDNHGF